MAIQTKGKRAGAKSGPRPAAEAAKVKRPKTVNAGGRAASGGVRFQVEVAAFVAAHLAVGAPLRISDEITLPAVRWLSMESQDDVDDVQFGGDAQLVFVQAKRTLDGSSRPKSELAKTADQFVRQVRNGATVSPTERRPLVSGSDWLLITVSSDTSATIGVELRDALLRRAGNPNAPLSLKQAAALRTWRAHVAAAWKRQAGATADEAELASVIGLTRIWKLDPEAMRSSGAQIVAPIIEGPTAPAAAWTTLEVICLWMSEQGLRGDLAWFHKRLAAAMRLKAPTDYQADVERVRSHSREMHRRLQRYAVLDTKEGPLPLVRESLEPLVRAARPRSLLVIGPPGGGKSGLLSAAAEVLEGEAEVVLLQVDQSANLGAVQANLNLDHSLLDVLARWPGRGPAYLVIDALDVVRGGPGETTYRGLIDSVIHLEGRWRILASVRSFDLKMGHELGRLFAGIPPAAGYADTQFAGVRHFDAPPWSTADLASLYAQRPTLEAAVAAGGGRLRDLVANPFNMSLLAGLLKDNVASSQFEQARTRTDLLRAYWTERVGVGAAALHAIADLVSGMLAAQRLEVHALSTNQPNATALDALALRGVILFEDDSYQFAHHVFFDYAVARTELGKPGDIAPRLARGAVNSLLLAPALQFWLANETGRLAPDLLWALLARLIADPALDPILRAELARLASELISNNHAPHLLAQLASAAPGGAPAKSVWHITTTMAAAPPSGAEAVSAWMRLADGLVAERTLIDVLRAILRAFPTATLPQAARAGLGGVARSLMSAALADPRLIPHVVPLAAPTMVETYDTDVGASRALMDQLLAPSHVAAHGHEELDWLARGAVTLAGADPDISARLWRVVFEAEADDPKRVRAMGTGQILSLTTTVGQELDMARYALREAFPDLLVRWPLAAARCCAAAVDGTAQRKGRSNAEARVRLDDRCGRSSRLRPDGSLAWAVFVDSDHSDLSMVLKAFAAALSTVPSALAIQLADAAIAASGSNLLVSRILKAGALRPADLGLHLLAYAELEAALASRETQAAAVVLIRAVRPHLAGPAEAALLARLGALDLPAWILPEILTPPGPPAAASAGQARVMRVGRTEAEIDASARSAGVHNPRHDWIQLSGADLAAPSNLAVLRETDDLRSLTAALAETAESQAVTALRDGVLAAAQALGTRAGAAVDQTVADVLAEQIVGSIGEVLAQECSTAEDAAALIPILVSFVREPIPAQGPQLDELEEGYEGSGGYARPNPRIDALRTLLEYAARPEVWSSEVAQLVEDLGAPGQHPAARGYVASRLHHVHAVDPGFVWRIAATMAANEPNPAVVADLLDSLAELAVRDPASTGPVFAALVPRLEAFDERTAEAVAHVRLTLGVWGGDATYLAELADDTDHALDQPDLAFKIVQGLRAAVVARTPLGGVAIEVRTRARDLLTRVLDAVEPTFAAAAASSDGEATERELNAVRLIDLITNQLFFGAGAFRVESETYVDPLPDPAAKRQFLELFEPLIAQLALTGTVKATHHLVQLLTHLAPAAPELAFALATRAILRPNAVTPYQHETMAVDQVLKLFGLLISDHRELFDELARRDALIDCLELFLEAGWPSIRTFTLGLPEMLY